jgi:catechol 2,3-dioxygenase-like lactoylglutathione lyase family enzyme
MEKEPEMLKPLCLIQGHYECRSLAETVPIFTDLLAMDVVERTAGQAILKHPNTEWLLVAHEGGSDAPDKPHNNHYGFRVARPEEIAAAWKYLEANSDRYGIRRVTPPRESHYANSIYLAEPGGNDLEIEYYAPEAVAAGRSIAAPHWARPLPEARFPGRGYVPQALTHGTLECDDKEASERFYRNVLGLEIAGGGRISTYIKHSSTPWYIVVLPVKRRHYLGRSNRFTLRVASPEAVEEAHRLFATTGKSLGIAALDDLQHCAGAVAFTFSDLDRNWWEVTAA